MNKLLIFTLLVAGIHTASAQQHSITSDSLKWTFTAFDNLVSNEQVAQAGYFTSTPQQVVWVQNNGEKTYTFNIVSSSGTWTNVLQNGTITLSVTIGTREGTLTFTRSSASVTITMNFIINGKNVMPYRYHVQTITPL